MSITIREIAAQAGVTKSTVSKVLNNRPGVGSVTRERVKSVIERTGFRPSSSARALARGSTENIGFLIPREAGFSLNGAYWSALTSSIALEAGNRGHNLLLVTPDKDGGEEKLVEELVSHRKAEGLIVGHPLLANESLTLLAERDFPFVTIGRNPGWESWAIDVDNIGGAASVTEYMLKQGFRNIAMIDGPESLLHMRDRSRGFRETLAGSNLSPAGIIHCEFDQDSVNHAVAQLVHESRERTIDSLFLGSGGEFLLRVFRAMELHGFDRRRIGITVFDDYPHLEFMDEGITAVRQPTEELGRRAVQLLDERIAGAPVLNEPIILSTEIVPRKSCGE